MTLIEMICAMVIMSFFLIGFSEVFLPAYKAWEKAMKTYQTGKTIYFVSESFKIECAKQDRNIDRWKQTVSAAKELEDYNVCEYWRENILCALKLTCFINGEKIEILGVCTP